MDTVSVLTQLIELTTIGPLTYFVLFGGTIHYIIHYIVGVENVKTYFSSKVQSLKRKVDEEKIIELEKKVLLKRLKEQAADFLDSYEVYTNGRISHDEEILDYIVEDILKKQQNFKEIMKTRKSILLKKRLEEKAKKS